MAKRFCGDVRITISYRWSMNQYKAQVSCTRGTRTIRLSYDKVRAKFTPFMMALSARDSSEAYDIAAKMALEDAIDATSSANDNESYVAKEIADSAALGIEAGGYKVLREKEYTVWVGQQLGMMAGPIFAGNI